MINNEERHKSKKLKEPKSQFGKYQLKLAIVMRKKNRRDN